MSICLCHRTLKSKRPIIITLSAFSTHVVILLPLAVVVLTVVQYNWGFNLHGRFAPATRVSFGRTLFDVSLNRVYLLCSSLYYSLCCWYRSEADQHLDIMPWYNATFKYNNNNNSETPVVHIFYGVVLLQSLRLRSLCCPIRSSPSDVTFSYPTHL